MPSNKQPLILSLLLLLITFSVFQHVPSHDFMDWDDNRNIIENPYMNPVTPASIERFWRAPYNSLYTPLTNTVWAAAAVIAWDKEPHPRQSGGITHLAPDVFHGLGVLVHLTNVLILFALLRRLVKKDLPAAAGALLFGVHPIQVESVAWVTGMNNTLAALFGLLSLLFYTRWAEIKGGGERRLATPDSGLATLFYCLALLSKPTATALPIVALVLEAGIFQRKAREFAPILLLWVALAGGMVLATRQASDASSLVYLPLTSRPFVILDAIAFYLGRLVWPVRFCPDYGRLPLIVLSSWWGYVTGLVPLSLALAIWHFRLRRAAVVLGIFVAGALPVLGIVPYYLHTMSTVGDRFVYLSMLGPALGLAWLLTTAPVERRPRITCSVLVIVFAALAILSYQQTERWKLTETLFKHTLSVNPSSVRALNNLGALNAARGDRKQAIVYYQRAIDIDPDMSPSQYNLGTIFLQQDNTKKAFVYLWRARQTDPFDPNNRENLGAAYINLGRPEEAKREFEEALRIQDTPLLHYHLGVASLKLGDTTRARSEFLHALQMDPNLAPAKRSLKTMGSDGKNASKRDAR